MIIKDRMKPQPRGKKNEEKNKAMLTQNDLQQIKTIVHDVVQSETRIIVKEELKRELTPIKRKLNRVAKDLNYVIKSYDKRISTNEIAIEVLKQHVGIVTQ